MTEWGMLLLCAYIALGATGRLTRRQAGHAALAVTIVVLVGAMVEYKTTTPTDKYIRDAASPVYSTGLPATGGLNPQQPVTSASEDVTGVKPANWYTTDPAPGGGG